MNVRIRAAAREIGVVAASTAVVMAASLGVVALQTGWSYLEPADLYILAIAGLLASAVGRVTLRAHRHWKRFIGSRTAAAALCAVVAIAGTLLTMIPGACPGAYDTSTCDGRTAASWGLVFGLVAAMSFLVAGGTLAVVRTVRTVAADGFAQIAEWFGSLRALVSRRRSAEPTAPARGEPKGRPTPRRAAAERSRRTRLRRTPS